VKQVFAPAEPRILIVDDHRISRLFMAAALRDYSGSVKQASTPKQALAVALHWLPEVILLDVMLGESNGFEVARRIRKRWPRNTALPRIVMLSANPPNGDRTHVVPVEADRFLRKPFSARQLLDAVEQAHRNPSAERCDARPPERLRDLLREELTARLGPLDRFLSEPDLAAAGAILHQLIASSAFCQQPALERDLRSLNSACGEVANSRRLAREYYAFLVTARAYLERS
jgi:CheY-like chemotaxis protein